MPYNKGVLSWHRTTKIKNQDSINQVLHKSLTNGRKTSNKVVQVKPVKLVANNLADNLLHQQLQTEALLLAASQDNLTNQAKVNQVKLVDLLLNSN